MRFLLSTTLLLFLSFPSSVLSETVDWDDLVKREGLLYKKFTNVPFTGEVEGKKQGRVKNGKREGGNRRRSGLDCKVRVGSSITWQHEDEVFLPKGGGLGQAYVGA
jgi:hypothetical protein